MAFDPNEYLKSGPIETESFDPNAYLGIKKKKGLLAAGERGARGLIGSLQTGIESLLPQENAAANAAIKGVERQEQIAQEIEAPASLEKVKEAYRKKGLLSAAGEVASQIPGAIVEQVPQLGAMVAGARLGSRAGPWGALIGAAAVPLAQFYGSNLQRQAQEQISAGTPVDVDRGKAALAAAPQAAFDIVQQRLLFGSKLFSKALGIPEATLAKQSATQVEKLAQEKLLPTLLKGTAKGVAAEIPTEIGQQMIERAQAGLSLTSPDALAEYGETAYQVGLLGPLGAVGRISDKGAARAEIAGRQAADAAILADQQNQVQPPVGGMMPVTPGAPIATPPATVPTLFEPSELPAQLTPDEIAGQTLAGKPVVTEALPLEQQRISELERNIEALVQQNTPEALAKAEALKQQLPESPQAKVTRLGEEMMTLERKYKELEAQRDATKPLKEKEPLSLQMNAIRGRQNEILNEGKVLEQEGVDFAPAEGLFAVEGKRKPQVAEQAELLLEPAPVVDEATLDTFGVTKAAPIRKKLLGLDMTKPEDREVFKDEVDKHTIKKAKIDMPAVDQYFNYFEEAPSEPGTISDVGTRAGQPSVSMPSGEFRPTPGLEASSVAGLAGIEPDVGGPFAGTRAARKIGKASVERPELLGKTTINLADRITQGDLKGALEDIANGKQYSPLDNLVAKRLLQAKTLPKVEIVSLEVTGGYPAQYDPNTDTVQITAGNIDSHTVLHETVHGFLHVMIRQSEAREARGLGGNTRLNSLKDVYNHVKAKRPDLVNKYGMKDLSEFASEVMSNPDFQNDLRNTPYRRSNVFTEFARAVLRAIGITPDQSGIADIDSLAGALMAAEGALSTGRKMQEDVQGGVRQQTDLDVVRALGNDYGFSGPDTLGLTDKRLDELFWDSGYVQNEAEAKAKGFIGYVNPVDFLNATRTYDVAVKQETKENRPLDKEQLAKQGPITLFVKPSETFGDMLMIDDHDGRHRMMALRDAGVTQVPVYFNLGRGENRTTLNFMHISPQRWGSESAIKGFMVRELVPVNYNNRKLLKEKFGAKEGQIAYMEPGAFKKWFGDSKVVNPDGSPMVVYHGTTQDIKQFKMSKEGSLGAGIYMTPSTAFANNYAGMPTPDELAAIEAGGLMTPQQIAQLKAIQETGELVEGQMGGNVVPVYASIEKPLIINTTDRRIDPMRDALITLGVKPEKAEAIVEKAYEDKGGITKEVMSRAQKQGYDGIMQYRDGVLMEVVAFSPYQVKSAIGNTGEFSRASADIAKVAPSQNLVDLYGKMTTADEKAARSGYGQDRRVATMASRRYLEAMKKATGTEETTSPEYLTVHQAVVDEHERQQGFDIPKVQRTPQGSQAEADMLAFGGKPAPKEQSFIDRQKDKFNASKAKWQESYELNNDWVSATFGKMQNIASFDQAFNNRLYNHFNNLKKQGVMTMQQVESALIRISISQAVHRGNLANQIIDRGNYTYDPVTNRWNSVEDPVNMKAFEGLIRSLATKLGVDPNRARQIMGAAYEANRLQSMYQDLDTATKELAQAETDLKTIKDPKLKATKKKLIDALKADVESLTDKVQHKNPAQIEAGMRLYNSHPEIQEGTKVWNTMRERVVKMLVETGVKTPEQAEAWLDEAAYVPFFRDMEEEKAIGPQIMSRGMRESMRDYGMKGSMRDVNDPIENMYQWMQWSIARAISNKQLQVMLDSYRDALPSEVRDGKGVNGKTFSIYRDGVQRFYNVDDAAVAQAFMGLEPVVFPAIKYFANTSNFLRHAVTRMPLFPVVQIFNDSYNAMFVSGLKNPFGLLKEIAKEVVATTRGTSETRNKLIQAGILETQDYNALNEAEAIGQRLNLNEPGAWAKLARNLDRFSSASDNVIRQGIYNQARKEGLSHEVAMEKAAEVVNFRRISSNETMQLLSRIVPFFNAYTQVASVAVKTLTGRGISPQERDVATRTLIATTTKIMLLSMLYSMAVGDDEDYLKKNRVSRDRMFMIPGSGGFGIPIRMDMFAIPKLAGEYGYQLMTDSMFTDSKMVREAMSRAIRGSIMPPSEGVPQLVRPALGVMMNYDAFQDREIINATMRRLDPERQYTKTTSEMAKALGAMTGISPLNIDFLLRGYLGSVATLSALATNDAINAVRGGPPRPDQSIGNIISSLPNMGAMMSKEENTAVLTDFYEVARDVNKAVDTLSSMKYASPEAKQAYREEHKKELALKGQVQAINKQLTVLRRREQMVREAPEGRMSAEQKQAELKRIDEMRNRMTQNIMRVRQKLYE